MPEHVKNSSTAEADRKKIFAEHFEALYVTHRGSYDISQGDLFSAIMEQYYELTRKVKTEHLKDFIRTSFKADWPKPLIWENAAREYASKYNPPTSLQEEEPQRVKMSSFGHMVCKIMMQPFRGCQYRQLAQAILFRRYYDKRGQSTPGNFLNIIASHTAAQVQEVTEYLKTYQFVRPLDAKRKLEDDMIRRRKERYQKEQEGSING